MLKVHKLGSFRPSTVVFTSSSLYSQSNTKEYKDLEVPGKVKTQSDFLNEKISPYLIISTLYSPACKVSGKVFWKKGTNFF
jgi:hypothetical protein